MPVEKICESCGKGFLVPPNRKGSARFCSVRCRKVAGWSDEKTTVIRTCPTCGKEFKTKEAWIRKGGGVFCSRECIRQRDTKSLWWKRSGSVQKDIDVELATHLYTEEGFGTTELAEMFGVCSATIASRLKMAGVVLRTNKEAQRLRSTLCKSTGENSYRWTGGRKYNRGYVEIYRPDHYRANQKGYVREHILVWEAHNNKKVPKGWVVHHYNGIKDDNRPENLFAMPNKDHSRKELGSEYKKKIRQLESEIESLRAVVNNNQD